MTTFVSSITISRRQDHKKSTVYRRMILTYCDAVFTFRYYGRKNSDIYASLSRTNSPAINLETQQNRNLNLEQTLLERRNINLDATIERRNTGEKPRECDAGETCSECAEAARKLAVNKSDVSADARLQETINFIGKFL